MGGGGSEPERNLDQTPTWAVALVSAIIIVISIGLEKTLHAFGETFERRKKRALYEALEKIKGELMILGFISLLLTFGQSYIAKICIPEKIGYTMLPCPSRLGDHGSSHHDPSHHDPSHHEEEPKSDHGAEAEHHRRLLWYEHRILSGHGPAPACKEGHVPLMSINGIHQLHIFIFFLAVFHVIYSAITMTLGRLKIRGWKEWEQEIVNDSESNDPSRFRLTRDTSFVRDHTSFWTKNPILFHATCFFRQFFRSVRKSDYLTMRHGFISVHLSPGSKFDFQKYIKRSLEDDFKIVVGINAGLWFSAVIYLLLNVHGWRSNYSLSIMPLATILSIGMKLQAIITQMAVEIQERHAVVQGIPLVQGSDSYFWFGKPTLVLQLIHLTLFQNAFEITNFIWISYEFGLHSCFHDNFYFSVFRVILGLGAQVLCSYSTLPLYALVTQMGSTMKKSIFDEETSKALMKWHKHAKKKKEEDHHRPANKKSEGSPRGSPNGSQNTDDANRGEANITTSVDIPMETLAAETEGPRHRNSPRSPASP